MKTELKVTSDGSHTLYVPELDEHYHSVHGAIQESMHVFIDKGIDALFCKRVEVLEIGFGTGLNALLTALWSMKHGLRVDYVGIEPFPLQAEVHRSLNYADQIGHGEAQKFFEKISDADWGRGEEIHPFFELTKIDKYVESYETDRQFDIVYFDAFAPNAQQEVWDQAILIKMHKYLKNKGLFVTYCAKGQLKRDLIEIGFDVETLEGPPGKREMIRARKI